MDQVALDKPIAVMPLHDPDGLLLPHLQIVTPQLKSLFSQAVVSVPRLTRERHPEQMAWLAAEPFFCVLHHADDPPVGMDFAMLYRFAAATCPPSAILHLCYPDRVAYALQSEHAAAFCHSIQSITPEDTPFIFHRSAAAWATHPQNYYDMEQMVTRTGELLLNQTFDFAWCHLVVQAQQLRGAAAAAKNPDISMVAELILALREHLTTREVDWLAWEDPFILGQDHTTLKQVREQSQAETLKRLRYVIPMLQLLQNLSL